jgi:hypothetical protein|tara:strand:- start:1124 stop:1333 length:210 start_codon:yes stop_codon:yes gene_type:complete
MKMKNKQYEIAVDIDEYIFNRYVKNKVREEYKDFTFYKVMNPKTKCYFILRNEDEDIDDHSKIYLWNVR